MLRKIFHMFKQFAPDNNWSCNKSEKDPWKVKSTCKQIHCSNIKRCWVRALTRSVSLTDRSIVRCLDGNIVFKTGTHSGTERVASCLHVFTYWVTQLHVFTTRSKVCDRCAAVTVRPRYLKVIRWNQFQVKRRGVIKRPNHLTKTLGSWRHDCNTKYRSVANFVTMCYSHALLNKVEEVGKMRYSLL